MPAKPFTRRGITFASQYAYRQFLAAEKGFASPAARNKAIKEARKVVDHYPGGLTACPRNCKHSFALWARTNTLSGEPSTYEYQISHQAPQAAQ